MLKIATPNIATYSISIILIAVGALYIGYRLGITRLFGNVLGFTFGIVLAYLLSPPMIEWLNEQTTLNTDPILNDFGLEILACAIIFLGSLLLFSATTPIWRAITSWHEQGLLSSVVGAVYLFIEWMIILSFALNIFMVATNDRDLMKKGSDGDGNVCAGILVLAPAIMNTSDISEIRNSIQLRDAKYISLNETYSPNVSINGEKIKDNG